MPLSILAVPRDMVSKWLHLQKTLGDVVKALIINLGLETTKPAHLKRFLYCAVPTALEIRLFSFN